MNSYLPSIEFQAASVSVLPLSRARCNGAKQLFWVPLLSFSACLDLGCGFFRRLPVELLQGLSFQSIVESLVEQPVSIPFRICMAVPPREFLYVTLQATGFCRLEAIWEGYSASGAVSPGSAEVLHLGHD